MTLGRAPVEPRGATTGPAVGELITVRLADLDRPVEARVLALRMVGRSKHPVYIVAARTGRDGHIWERLIVAHRQVTRPATGTIGATAGRSRWHRLPRLPAIGRRAG